MGYRTACGRCHRINRTGHPRALFRQQLGGPIILVSIVVCQEICSLDRTGLLYIWLNWITLDGVTQVNSILRYLRPLTSTM